ncbi:hypothetical protein [Williamsia sp.]|uniref:hypothetical protein n=1 Tax=Williamsia sp. TaxID=1872085 RepID=UPI002F920CA3
MGEQFDVDEVTTIHNVGTKLITLAAGFREITAEPGFADCATAMPNSAIAGVCAGKDALITDLLSRASGRVEQIGNACTDTGNEIIDTEEESAAGFRAIGEF